MKRMNKAIAGLLLMMLLLVTAGCSKPQAEAGEKVFSGEVTVDMKNMKFIPRNLTVKKGTTITFVNKDAMLHDVVQITVQDYGKEKPSFDSGEVMPGKSWAYTFDKPGTYPIICTQASHFAAGMTGTVTVVE